MKITIIGTGYVGLTTGVCLAYLGNEVVCIDIDENKISKLAQGIPTIYEPHLKELMQVSKSKLSFTNDFSTSISSSDVIFITVGTPSLKDGSPNLDYVRSAADLIGKNLGNRFTVVINKSTVPIGSGNWVESLIQESFKARNGHRTTGEFAVASNPEFLREGSALYDTFYPDRIVVGSDRASALELLHLLYKPITEQSFVPPPFLPRPERLGTIPLVTTDLASAELIKYAANAFLALKISFINEVGQLAEKVGADIQPIATGIGCDSRIGAGFLQAGIGWGGSCFGKDTAALIATAQEYGLSMPIVNAAREVNYNQRGRIIGKLLSELKILKGKTVGLLGLTFKANTDDLRDAPSLDIARRLLEKGAKLRVHDPVALDQVKYEEPFLKEACCDFPEAVAEEADALILVTDWPLYRELAWESIFQKMRLPLIIDGRNFLDGHYLKKLGFKYIGMGR